VQYYAERVYMPQSVVLSVHLSVTFRYVFHTGWNTSKIISLPNSLRYLLKLTQHGWSGPVWILPELGCIRGGVRNTKNISETVQDRTKITMMD